MSQFSQGFVPFELPPHRRELPSHKELRRLDVESLLSLLQGSVSPDHGQPASSSEDQSESRDRVNQLLSALDQALVPASVVNGRMSDSQIAKKRPNAQAFALRLLDVASRLLDGPIERIRKGIVIESYRASEVLSLQLCVARGLVSMVGDAADFLENQPQIVQSFLVCADKFLSLLSLVSEKSTTSDRLGFTPGLLRALVNCYDYQSDVDPENKVSRPADFASHLPLLEKIFQGLKAGEVTIDRLGTASNIARLLEGVNHPSAHLLLQAIFECYRADALKDFSTASFAKNSEDVALSVDYFTTIIEACARSKIGAGFDRYFLELWYSESEFVIEGLWAISLSEPRRAVELLLERIDDLGAAIDPASVGESVWRLVEDSASATDFVDVLRAIAPIRQRELVKLICQSIDAHVEDCEAMENPIADKGSIIEFMQVIQSLVTEPRKSQRPSGKPNPEQ